MKQSIEFLRGVRSVDISDAVKQRAIELLLDLLGVACAASQTRMSRIASEHAAMYLGSGEQPGARILLDGRRASVLGAAWAGAATIDSYDAHDGHALTKGHAGVVLLPSMLALCDAGLASRRAEEFMTSLVVGYEIATRAGIALHGHAPEYHCSGSWNALGVAAMACRAMHLDAGRCAEAFGIADYHAPRGQMLRGVDHPTMVKDGAGPGAFTGLQASLLARAGFTGAPARAVSDPAIWSDLGERWRLMEQYVKPYPVCRWAQPAIEAAVALQREHAVAVSDLRSVRIETFHEATRLAHPAPRSPEEAQYSLPFPLAAILVHGDLGPARIDESAIRDAAVLDLAARVELVCDEPLAAAFPARRLARAVFTLRNGARLVSGIHEARGEPANPLTREDLLAKFHSLAAPVLGGHHERLMQWALQCWDTSAQPVEEMVATLLTSPGGSPA